MAVITQEVKANPALQLHVGSPLVAGKVAQVHTEFWTPERIQQAQPKTMPKLVVDPKAPLLVPKPTGALQQTVHNMGSVALPAAPTAPVVRDHRTGGQQVASPLAYPYRVCGRIFFTQNGSGFSGSASLVAPNVLLTAGHCVHDNGHWSENMVFYPSYGSRATTDPFYKIACGRLGAKTTWVNNSDRAHDYGVAWMPTGPGNSLGWLGTMWNASHDNRSWEAVGYPATPNPPFDGSKMDHCTGQFAASSTSGTLGLTNDNMEHGSSGGPWITAFNETTATHANGLQSYHINDGDFTEYGPYFDDNFHELWNWIQQPANH
jgi:V8-like Glu-specific endopeptidase